MWTNHPKTLILPQDKQKQEKLRRYLAGIQAMLPPDHRVRHDGDAAIAIQVLLLHQLFQEGMMINTQTFLEEMSEQNPPFHQLLNDVPYIFEIAVVDLNHKIKNV